MCHKHKNTYFIIRNESWRCLAQFPSDYQKKGNNPRKCAETTVLPPTEASPAFLYPRLSYHRISYCFHHLHVILIKTLLISAQTYQRKMRP